MRKLNVAVLFGGRSAERKVSIATGARVIAELNRKKYSVIPIEIDSYGQFWKCRGVKTTNYPQLLKKTKVDIVFIALHGPYGEDGTIQGLLDLIGVPYTGSGVLASSLGMDKVASRKLFEMARLKVPKYTIDEQKSPMKLGNLHWPLFVQPNNLGSAIGASIAKDGNSLKASLKLAHRHSNTVLVDEFIKGIEVTCAIIGNSRPTALPLVEIISKHDFFDYEAKYNPELVDEICPARIKKSLALKTKQAALTAYKIVNCRAFGRVDMIISGNDIFVLEVNTIPGLTSVSLFPKAAKAAGISYSRLLDHIINYSLDAR